MSTDFQLDAHGDFLDLNLSYVELQLSMTDNNNLAKTADITDTMIAPLNNFACSIFKQINMKFNGTLVSWQTRHLPLESLYGNSIENNRRDSETILVPQGWYNHITAVSQYTAANINQSALWANSWIEKKRLEVNVGEKWNLLSFVVNIRKSRQYCLNENINDSLFIKWDKRERVLSDITKLRLPPSFWISTWVDLSHVLGNV